MTTEADLRAEIAAAHLNPDAPVVHHGRRMTLLQSMAETNGVSVDRGEHTETATRAGEAEAVEAAADGYADAAPEEGCDMIAMRAAVAAAYPIIAAAVRAEEREQAGLRVDVYVEQMQAALDRVTTPTATVMLEDCVDVGKVAARLARGSS